MIKNDKGFSFLEMLIAVAVLGLIVTIAIPALTRTKLNANQNLAEASLKTVSTTFETYRSAAQPPSYPSDFLDLTTTDPQYIELSLSSATTFTKNGYDFELDTISDSSFTIEAAPTTVGQTGNTYYCIDATGEVYSNSSGFDPATTTCTDA